jgi:hypothetical protein
MTDKAEDTGRPVYRHLIVKRPESVQFTTDPRKLREAHAQLKRVQSGELAYEDMDPEYKKLTRRNYLRKTMKTVYGDDYTDPEEGMDPGESSYGGAIVVGTLRKHKIPGGTEPLPQHATFFSERVDFEGKSPQEAFIEAAERLQKRFRKHSDLQISNLPKETRAGVTLVTVAYSPIIAYPLEDIGFEVGMEFIQKTRWGSVSSADFIVESEDGTYPIQPPSDGTVVTMMASADEVPDVGFLSDEQKQAIKEGRTPTV